ncbi:hypothetical protein, partial [Marinobacter lutaoensis]|uniref:hypothetical protein n=1 Tax=Marinobacter lutaoensis TaxID=135739 RepID=UPI001593F23A
MNDKAIYVLAHIGNFSLFFGLLPLLVILTISFRYVILIEHRVATEGSAISAARVIWTGKVIGRLMRSSNVFAYLVLRSTPFPFLRRRASLELLSNLVYGIRPRSCLIDPVLVRRP